MDFLVVLERGESGHVIADVPELPGCHTSGRTREEALANVREAIEIYLQAEGTQRRRAVSVEHVSVEG